MNNHDILGYYLSKFTQIEGEVINTITDESETKLEGSFDVSTRAGQIELRTQLVKLRSLTETEIEILMSKIVK
jgi:hypothetical protein